MPGMAAPWRWGGLASADATGAPCMCTDDLPGWPSCRGGASVPPRRCQGKSGSAAPPCQALQLGTRGHWENLAYGKDARDHLAGHLAGPAERVAGRGTLSLPSRRRRRQGETHSAPRCPDLCLEPGTQGTPRCCADEGVTH